MVPIGLFCSLALLTACDPMVISSNVKENPTVQPSQELVTRCIGRYLIDLPRDIILMPLGGQTIDEVQISVTPATEDEYTKGLARRTAELKAAVVSRKGVQYPALRSTVPLPAATSGVLFDRAKLQGVAGRMARVMEVFAWRDGYLLKAEIAAVDTSFLEEKDNETLHAHVKTDVTEKTRQIIDVVLRTRGRTDNEIPSQQGICIVNGFVLGPPTARESVGAIYRFANIDNFFMRVASSSLSPGKDTVLERIENIRPIVERSKGRVFKKARHDVAGMNGYEAAYSMLTDDDAVKGRVMVDRFVFELNSAEGSAHKPRLTVEMVNGQSIADDLENDDGEPGGIAVPLKNAPLSTSAAEATWDRIIKTIRVRPNAF